MPVRWIAVNVSSPGSARFDITPRRDGWFDITLWRDGWFDITLWRDGWFDITPGRDGWKRQKKDVSRDMSV